MLKHLRDNLRKWVAREERATPPVITERSTLSEIEKLYPRTLQFFKERYALSLSSAQKKMSLASLVRRLSIPAQILYMEIQLFHQNCQAREIDARDAKKWIDEDLNLVVLDVREKWEREVATLPRSQPLTDELMAAEVTHWGRERGILVYCHFGIRSVDAAIYLASEGFTNVRVLKGGIDAWSQLVDPEVRRYEQAWC